MSLINLKIFDDRLQQANLANKDDITDFIKKSDFDTKLTKVNNKVSSNKTEHVEVKNDLTDVSKNFYKHQ